MREFFSSVKFKIILCVLALLVGLMIYSATTSGSATAPEAILGAIISPIQRASSNLSSRARSSIDKLINADKYYKENEVLKDQIAELYGQIANATDIEHENEMLRDVIGLKEDNPDFVFSPPANIIGRESGNLFGAFTIDKGTLDGISKDDPVISPNGLIGIVTEVAPTYARVTTMLSPDIDIGVYSSREKVTGIVTGDIALAKEGKCKMQYILKDSDIKEGDIIVTAGRSGIYPEGRVVGVVDEVGVEDSGLSLYAIITPVVDSNKINSVFVITNFKGKGLGYE